MDQGRTAVRPTDEPTLEVPIAGRNQRLLKCPCEKQTMVTSDGAKTYSFRLNAFPCSELVQNLEME
jgi:hypothetical protein